MKTSRPEDVATEGGRPVAATLWDALERLASAEGDRGRRVTILDREGGRESRGWSRILSSALRVAGALERLDVEAGDRIVISLPTSFEFLSAFFGVMAVGAVPVIVPTSGRSRGRRFSVSQPSAQTGREVGACGLIRDSEGAHSSRRAPRIRDPFDWRADVDALLGEVSADPLERPAPTPPDETAYLQMTEGTTGRPRAVPLSDAKILANVRAMGHAFDVRRDDVGVSWIPLHNALGLVGVLLFGVVHQLDLVLIDPARFLQRPVSWLKAISTYDGTLSPAPNFAFDYTTRRCRESDLQDIDLGSWRIAMNGGEPVRGQHMDAFARRFGPYGLDDDILTPVYGLSEATLGVCSERPDEPVEMDAINRRVLERTWTAQPLPEQGASSPPERMHLVSVGQPLSGYEVEIVSVERRSADGEVVSVGPRELGEIAVRGPSVTSQYADDRGGRPIHDGWLMTGDLGYRADGSIYVVSRLSSVVRMREDDRTIFPEEVEVFVDAVDGVYAGRTAVFGVGEDEATADEPIPVCERLVVALEVHSGANRADVAESVREMLDRHLKLEPEVVECVSPRSIPRTKSGNVRRPIARRLFVEGRLDRRDRNPGIDWVYGWANVLRGDVRALGRRFTQRISDLFS